MLILHRTETHATGHGSRKSCIVFIGQADHGRDTYDGARECAGGVRVLCEEPDERGTAEHHGGTELGSGGATD